MEKVSVNHQQLAQANINNLTSLWRSYEYQQQLSDKDASYDSPIVFNNDWPHRIWLNSDSQCSHSELIQRLAKAHSGSIFPLWPAALNSDNSKDEQLATAKRYIRQHWQFSFEQSAMYLPISGTSTAYDLGDHLNPGNAVTIRVIKTAQEIITWAEIGSSAFGYHIPPQVIAQLNENKNATLLLASKNGTAVACGLIYQTGKIAGVHQIAILPEYQGQGLAKLLMLEIIKRCQHLAADYIVLQASAAGKPLYQKLGFKEQFTINNYQKP